ncbi:hypothetical protein BU26DRAFT_565126 [Trematosphaeria pertusa]|uniref:BTB domain-containing protein n=1 Tax=Trematosphaeria pertusa TaxID=390896 RepID=A0A6A6IIT3_9PLEO|nr:uncharacterized protein BU26DRAFT_565126 [Trematosphaeria pertusa]KAF2249480.1 hypothetical protein BU26DRAFT_565126 [Trematosphaeria pertusa]
MVQKIDPIIDQELIKDVRALGEFERNALAQGPTVTIFIGQKPTVYEMSKRVIMAISPLANEYFNNDPAAIELHIPSDKFHWVGVLVLAQWMTHVCKSPRPFSIRGSHNPLEDISIYTAARGLGLDLYIHPIFTKLEEFVKGTEHGLLHYEELDAICKCDSDDRLFMTTTSVYARLRYYEQIPDPEEFDDFLSKHPRFEKALDWVQTNLEKRNGKPTASICHELGGD